MGIRNRCRDLGGLQALESLPSSALGHLRLGTEPGRGCSGPFWGVWVKRGGVGWSERIQAVKGRPTYPTLSLPRDWQKVGVT